MLNTPHFARTVTGCTGNRAAAGLGPTAMTYGTNFRATNFYFFIGTKNGFFKRDGQVSPQISPTPRPMSATTVSAKANVKQLFKDVTDVAKAAFKAAKTAGTIFYTGMAVCVIHIALLIVRKHFVSTLYLFKLIFGAIIFVNIRMILSCLFTVSFFNLVFRCASGHAQHIIKVSLCGHTFPCVTL